MVDEWSGLAELLANLIEKYASDLDVDKLPDIEMKGSMKNEEEKVEEIETIRNYSCDKPRYTI